MKNIIVLGNISKIFVALCFSLVLASSAYANTILKLNLSSTGPDVGLSSGFFGTTDDLISGTTGQQNTDVLFEGSLGFIPDINSGASFTLAGVTASGNVIQISSGGTTTISQSTIGGSFSLWDANNDLLLSGTVNTGEISGANASTMGSFFTTTVGSLTGGSLRQYLDIPQGVELSFALGQITSGSQSGLVYVNNGYLPDFTANADGVIDAHMIPEPSTLLFLSTGLLVGALIVFRSRRFQKNRQHPSGSDPTLLA
jgi:hypothetical protein